MRQEKRPEVSFRLGNEALTEKWLDMYVRFSVGVVGFVCLTEISFYFILRHLNRLYGSTMTYMVMYILLPFALNGLGIFLAELIRRRVKSLWCKACAVSLMYVFLAFVIYTVHLQYPSLCIAFALVIFMTVIYGDWKLTTITYAASVAAKVVSDGFLVWDTRFIQHRLLHMEDQLDFAVSLLILLAVYAVCLVIIQIEQEKQTIRSRLEMEKVRLYEETMTDSLTGIRNRNALRVAFDKMMADASEAQYVLVMLDMDHFKEINDTYGHMVGDQYIQQLSCVLDAVPEADAFRFGGDEFCLLFRGSTRFQVEQSCQRAQETFRDCKLCRTCQEVTVSFGAAQYQKDLPPSELVRRADEALYRAKRMRGTLQFFGEMSTEQERFSE